MGAWSTSVTGNDVAQDMRDEFRAAFALNAPEDAVKKLDAYAKQALLSDEWTDYLYALADFMEKNGVLTEDVRARAIASIDSGEDLARWNGESQSRKMALEALVRAWLRRERRKGKSDCRLKIRRSRRAI